MPEQEFLIAFFGRDISLTDVPSPQLVRLVLLVIITASGCGRGGEQPPIFTPHHPALKTLSNGMELMLIEDHEFPTAQLHFFIRGGTVYDPPGKEGLASIAMQEGPGRTVPVGFQGVRDIRLWRGESLGASADA